MSTQTTLHLWIGCDVTFVTCLNLKNLNLSIFELKINVKVGS